jgi:hypothetical protein
MIKLEVEEQDHPATSVTRNRDSEAKDKAATNTDFSSHFTYKHKTITCWAPRRWRGTDLLQPVAKKPHADMACFCLAALPDGFHTILTGALFLDLGQHYTAGPAGVCRDVHG